MKEHCHPCDMIFIILWGKGTLQMESLQMLREPDTQIDQWRIAAISRTFLHQDHPTINRVTSSIQKKTSRINTSTPEVPRPQQLLKVHPCQHLSLVLSHPQVVLCTMMKIILPWVFNPLCPANFNAHFYSEIIMCWSEKSVAVTHVAGTPAVWHRW